MKRSVIYLTVLTAIAASTSMAESRDAAELLIVGPVESVDLANRIATVLGQRVALSNVDSLALGNTVAVFGTSRADGTIRATAIQDRGLYTAGATTIYLSGTVQQAEPSIGRVVVNGVSVDLTAAMSVGTLSPDVGSRMSIRGTQPVSRGLVLVDGIVGTGSSGIVGTGHSGIVGTGSSGIVGTGRSGIVGTGSSGIVGTGSSGIVGTGSSGIVGTGSL